MTTQIIIYKDGTAVKSAQSPATLAFAWNGGGTKDVSSIEWDFGDGMTSGEVTPTHKYGMPGKYTVSVVVNKGIPCIESDDSTTLLITKDVGVYFLDKCYRLGFYESQGMGPSEYQNWPQFPVGIGGGMCYDTDGQPHHIVFDQQYGIFYEISEPNGPTGSGLNKKWTDDDFLGNEQEIASEIHLAEIRGNKEHFQIEHSESHSYFRPYDETNRSQSGYDEYGYRNAEQVDVEWYLDGEQTTFNAKSINIPKTGDIVSDRKLVGKRGRMVIKMAAAEYVMTGYDQYWIEKDQSNDISENANTESDHQLALATGLTLWITRGKLKKSGSSVILFDKISGNSSHSSPGTIDAGADGNSNSAFKASGLNAINLGNIKLYFATGLPMFFYSSASAPVIKIGTDIMTVGDIYDTNISATFPIFTAESLQWHFATFSGPTCANYSGILTITPAALPFYLFDFRYYQDQYQNISIGDKEYLYNDMVYNHGNNICPIW